MKKSLCRLLALLTFLPTPASAAERLRFAPVIQDEALAETAIDLLRCLATRAGVEWEYSGVASGQHWLRVEERSGRLGGVYHNGAKETPFSLGRHEAEGTCETLADAGPVSLAPAPAEPVADLPDLPQATRPRSYWAWGAATAGVALVAGFLIWRGKQPDHRTVRMD